MRSRTSRVRRLSALSRPCLRTARSCRLPCIPTVESRLQCTLPIALAIVHGPSNKQSFSPNVLVFTAQNLPDYGSCHRVLRKAVSPTRGTSASSSADPLRHATICDCARFSTQKAFLAVFLGRGTRAEGLVRSVKVFQTCLSSPYRLARKGLVNS